MNVNTLQITWKDGIHILFRNLVYYGVNTPLGRFRNAYIVLLLRLGRLPLLRFVNQFLLDMRIVLSFPVRIHSCVGKRGSTLFAKRRSGIPPISGSFQRRAVGFAEIVLAYTLEAMMMDTETAIIGCVILSVLNVAVSSTYRV